MLTYNQRYRPRTTREFTKSDLTVYDSAGNTALNALTVYGKSEVVDGAIVSAGDSGNIEIETCEKNLLDPTKLVTENITYTDGVLSGTAISFENAYETGIPVLFVKTRRITFSVKAYTNGENPSGPGLKISFFYKDGTNDTLSIPNNTFTPQFFTLTSSGAKQVQYISISFNNGSTNIWYLSEIQLEYGSSATTYEPYNGTMAVFETGTPLRGIPDTDVKDVMTWDGSAGTVTKKYAKIRLADLTWQMPIDSGFSSPLDNSARGIIPLLCSAYNYNDAVSFQWANFSTYQDKNIYRNANITYIYIKDTDYTTVSDFVASLGDAELVYEIDTPTTEQLTQSENESIASLRTFDGTTHFTNNATIDMTINYTIKVPTIS